MASASQNEANESTPYMARIPDCEYCLFLAALSNFLSTSFILYQSSPIFPHGAFVMYFPSDSTHKDTCRSGNTID